MRFDWLFMPAARLTLSQGRSFDMRRSAVSSRLAASRLAALPPGRHSPPYRVRGRLWGELRLLSCVGLGHIVGRPLHVSQLSPWTPFTPVSSTGQALGRAASSVMRRPGSHRGPAASRLAAFPLDAIHPGRAASFSHALTCGHIVGRLLHVSQLPPNSDATHPGPSCVFLPCAGLR